MTARIRFTAEQFADLREHLHEPEEVAFAYASFAHGRFDVVELQAIGGRDISSRSGQHVELHDDVRPRLISDAFARGLSLVEAHSHGRFGYAAFSPTDLRGFDDWVPHLWWRLRGQPYAALVAAGDTWDGLAWITSPNEAQAVAAIEVSSGEADSRLIVPTGATIARLVDSDPRLRPSA